VDISVSCLVFFRDQHATETKVSRLKAPSRCDIFKNMRVHVTQQIHTCVFRFLSRDLNATEIKSLMSRGPDRLRLPPPHIQAQHDRWRKLARDTDNGDGDDDDGSD